MKLRFHPRGDALAFEPGAPMAVGQPKRYVGRKLNPATAQYEAVPEPYECEAGSLQAARMGKHLRAGDVWPADAETAAQFGVPFVAVELREGAFAPAAKATPKKESA